MYRFFIFECMHPKGIGKQPFTVVFCPDTEFDEKELTEEIKTHRQSEFPGFPAATLFVGTERCKPAFEAICGKRSGTLTSFTGETFGLWYKDEGGFDFGGLVEDNLSAKRTFETGIKHLFELRNPVLEASPVHHFVLPSGMHTGKFVRTGTMLARGAEVSFLAFCLLPHLKAGLKHIYTDTGTIHSVAYALIKLKKQLDSSFRSPTVESFGSYDGLERFVFHAKDESLFLISASGGSLPQDLQAKHGIDKDKIVTLFFVGNRPVGMHTLLDLGYLIPAGDSSWISFPPLQCQHCRDDSQPIRLVGDQMLPGQSRAEVVTIRVPHRPAWLPGFLGEFVGAGVMKCHRRPASEREPIELYIDLDGLLRLPLFGGEGDRQGRTFVRRLDRLLSQVIPASLGMVVYSNDNPACQALAKRVSDLHQSFILGHPGIRYAPLSELETCDGLPDSIFVVADTMVTGRNLAAASRALRLRHTDKQIQYFAAITRAGSKPKLDEIVTGLRFGPENLSYSFNSLVDVFLPDNLSSRPSPWSDERRLLITIKEWAIGCNWNPAEFDVIDRRIDRLDAAAANGGLEDDLFWGHPITGQKLELRPNFAFWRPLEYVKRQNKQAEVYFTLCAVLHNARQGGRTSLPWVQHDYKRTLLSPSCFHLYNDGVIQASILRAAEPAELDFRANETESLAMRDMFSHVFRNLESTSGEPAMEFLLALAGHKVRLFDKHARQALYSLALAEKHPPFLRLLGMFTKDALGCSPPEGSDGS